MITILSALVSLLSFRVRSRASLELELIALRHQVIVLRRQRPIAFGSSQLTVCTGSGSPAATRAPDHDERMVSFGQIVVFSTASGDTWLLDASDRLAARLARDGDPEPIEIEDTETTFSIGWEGQYRVEGAAFIYTDWDTKRTITILGYPTHKFAAMA
jgi:hypothetical protein